MRWDVGDEHDPHVVLRLRDQTQKHAGNCIAGGDDQRRWADDLVGGRPELYSNGGRKLENSKERKHGANQNGE